jgi:hypothetical protein
MGHEIKSRILSYDRELQRKRVLPELGSEPGIFFLFIYFIITPAAPQQCGQMILLKIVFIWYVHFSPVLISCAKTNLATLRTFSFASVIGADFANKLFI